ncbi:MAG TPA: tyrosine--tRNA ligase [Sedimentisphaerales bacterium]|jgi:tyrosyl-tRNA synthetase|nr:tyrosine--tRNA ligase [Sedimentisphaerales bacterium]HNU30342.1 tyrosine--tRNA ligase [Sedimentisphaerales bacterium]
MSTQIIEQLKQLSRGTVEIYTQQELGQRLGEAAQTGRQMRIKLGLDPTSPDIHLGHTVVLRKMRQFQDMGHKAVLIIGDYTARIGDPTGQNTTRPMLTPEQIERNAKTYFEQAGKILDTAPDKLEVRHNSEWLADLRLADIIRLASNMTVARMLERDTFELRYKKGDPIGVHEFLYPLMQGYDSVMVRSDVELGGTDQTFNNLVGRDLQRTNGQPAQIVITSPILVGLDGVQKMSKSKGNYVGVTDEPSNMFGKIMSISDAMMENYYTLLTDLPTERIAELTNPARTHPKEAKVLLGKTIVAQFHGQAAGDAAAAEFDKVFAQGQLPDDMPEVALSAQAISVKNLLTTCRLVETGGEAKRMVQQGGVSIDGQKAPDANAEITPRDGMVVQVGKRRFAKLRVK